MMVMMKLPILPCAEKLELVLSTAPRIWPRICRKCVCDRGFDPDPTGERTALPIRPSRLGRGHPSPYSTVLGAFGALTLASPTLWSAPTHSLWWLYATATSRGHSAASLKVWINVAIYCSYREKQKEGIRVHVLQNLKQNRRVAIIL